MPACLYCNVLREEQSSASAATGTVLAASCSPRQQGVNWSYVICAQVTGVRVPQSLCLATALCRQLGAEVPLPDQDLLLAVLSHARLDKLRLSDCADVLQVRYAACLYVLI